MKKLLAGSLLFGALLFCITSASATTITSRLNSGYGEVSPSSYATVTSLTGAHGTLLFDPTQPTGFDEELLCPISSSGCPATDYELFIETVTTPAAGSQISLDLGSNVTLGPDGLNLITCDAAHLVGTYCTPTVPSSTCLGEYSYTGAGTEFVTISLAADSSCIPSTLVFSVDEDLAVGSVAHFVTPTTGTAPTPEPGSLLLLASGLLPMAGFYRRRLKNRTRQ